MPYPPSQLYYVGLFTLSGVVSLLFAYRVKTQYDARGTKTLSYSFAGVGLWALNSAARTIASDPTVTALLLSTEIVLVVGIARIWFIFAAQYTNQAYHRDRRVQLALYGLVTAAVVLSLSNPWHGLLWPEITPVDGPFVHYTIAKGPVHYALTFSAYFLVAAGLWFLFRMLRSTSHTKAIVSLIVGFVLLVSANATPYVVDTTITHGTTVTPLGATAFVFMAAIAIRHNLFSVTPVGRDRVFGAIQDPVVVLDREDHVIDHNPAFAETFTDGSDVTHRLFTEACPRLTDGLDLPLDGPKHLVYATEEGNERSYTVTTSPLSTGPHLLGRVLVFRDITDLVTSQWELARKNSQLDEFADSVAHDIRNPLAVIVAHTDLLRTHLDQVASEDAIYDHHLSSNSLDLLEGHADRISSIVDDFLRVTRGAKTLHDVESHDFERTVRDAARDHIDLEALAVPVGGTFSASLPHARLLLEAVFRNISHRANGDLTVTAQLTDDGFVIEDTGEQVPNEVAAHLLEYGFTTKYRGEGLGLSIAKTIAESHKWAISLDPSYREGLRVVVRGVSTDPLVVDSDDPSLPRA